MRGQAAAEPIAEDFLHVAGRVSIGGGLSDADAAAAIDAFEARWQSHARVAEYVRALRGSMEWRPMARAAERG